VEPHRVMGGRLADWSGAAQAAEALARQTQEQAQDACEAQWGRNVLMVEHCRKQAGGAR
jgi:hypothetical protein